MTHKQSRRTQRALEKALFGPEPLPLSRPRLRVVKPQPEIFHSPGNCGFCGNECSLDAGHVFYCASCGSIYVAEGESL